MHCSRMLHSGFVTVTNDARTGGRGWSGVMRLRLHPATARSLRFGGFRSVVRETRWRAAPEGFIFDTDDCFDVLGN
jgi:hypothetical protein